ncbi:hypothetical protein EJ08DRAFT_694041 [Tothia fuscella]|uniref:Major facilitator superfamily (MFS) profile domain-containing protein n=1 Tax=Tothia fuscella TaxID=1048955 RepID=A0A9P4NZJ6_9PEZI|nr:hypothetical protein EJ08DRAFT_694041 [Tothia fuscella]
MIGLVAFVGGMAGATATTRSLALAFTIIASICLGYVENVAFTIAPFCIPAKDIGLALGLLGCVRSSVASVATAVFVSVLNNKLETNILKYVIPAATDAGLPASSTARASPEIIAAASAANQVAYTESFKIVYLSGIAFGAVGIVAALNTQNSEQFFNEEIARKLHGKEVEKKVAKTVDDEDVV